MLQVARGSGKRTLAQLNAFGLIVTVELCSDRSPMGLAIVPSATSTMTVATARRPMWWRKGMA
jgi:hypothetical protein